MTQHGTELPSHRVNLPGVIRVAKHGSQVAGVLVLQLPTRDIMLDMAFSSAVV